MPGDPADWLTWAPIGSIVLGLVVIVFCSLYFPSSDDPEKPE